MLSYRTHTSRSAVTSIQTYYYIMYCNIVVMTSYTSLDSVYYYFQPRAICIYVYACNIIYILYTQTFDDKFPRPETIAYFKFKRIRYYITLLCTPRNGRKILFWLKTYFCVCVCLQGGEGDVLRERERERMIHGSIFFRQFYIIYILYELK